MKIAPQRVEAFLRAPDPRVAAVLIYGPDLGLVRERAARLVTAVAGVADDPFRVVEIAPAALEDDRVRLADEAATLAPGGSRRVVRLRDGRDIAAPAVRVLLETETAAGLVVIEAGELGPRSPLRSLCESADRAAAIPCYVDTGEGLRRLVVDELRRRDIAVATEALDLLEAHLGADRGVTRQELEKLALYVGPGRRVETDDVRALVCGAGSVSLDALAFAAAGAAPSALDAGLARAADEGIGAIPILRATARHLQRLVQAQAIIATGASVKQAVESLKPAVFFRQQPEFCRQVAAWAPSTLATALRALAEAELRCKSSGAPQQLVCHQAMVRVAALADARRRG